MKKKLFKSISTTGFSSIPDNEGTRLINKDGSINIQRTGLPFSERFSFFHWLINMSWLNFFGILFSGYVLINFGFGFLFYIFGIDGLSGTHATNKFDQFLEAFYFSSQTLTTLGYGAISPISTTHNLIASFESFLGLLSFATSTGLLYGKISKPKVKLVFSKNALISPYKENQRGLMIRMVNSKNDQLINVNSSLILSWLEKVDGTEIRRFRKLNLEISHIDMLASSWTIVHPITEDSPFSIWKEEQLNEFKIEVYLQIDAYDETYAQQIHTRTSFKFDEFIWGAKFHSILGHNDKGQATLQLNKFNDFDLVELPKKEPISDH